MEEINKALNSVFQGLNKANQKGVFTLNESNTLFNSMIVIKKELEKSLQAQAQAQAQAQTQTQAQTQAQTIQMDVQKTT